MHIFSNNCRYRPFPCLWELEWRYTSHTELECRLRSGLVGRVGRSGGHWWRAVRCPLPVRTYALHELRALTYRSSARVRPTRCAFVTVSLANPRYFPSFLACVEQVQ